MRDKEKQRIDNRKYRANRQAWKKQFPKKNTAHVLVYNAVKRGELVKPDACSCCGLKGRIEAHHDDYDKPLDVRWLRTKCHREWHKNNEALNQI